MAISRDKKIGVLIGLTIATADKMAERERCYNQLQREWNISRAELADLTLRDEVYRVLFGITPAEIERPAKHQARAADSTAHA